MRSRKKKRADELKNYRAERDAEARTKVRSQVGDYLLVLHDAAVANDDKRRAWPGTETRAGRGPALSPGQQGMGQAGRSIFAPWFAFAALTPSFTAQAKDLATTFAAGADGTNRVNPEVAKLFDPEKPPAALKDVAEAYNKLFADVDKEWHEARRILLRSSRWRMPIARLSGKCSTGRMPLQKLEADELHRLFATPVQQKLRALKRKIDELDATHRGRRPSHGARGQCDADEPARFQTRQSEQSRRRSAARFLEIVSGPSRKPFTKEAGDWRWRRRSPAATTRSRPAFG
jgi:hypothetical protein